MDTYKPSYPPEVSTGTTSSQEKDKSPSSPSKTSKHERKEGVLRPHFLKTKVVTQANGSAYVEVEATKVICSIYGPRQIKQGDFKEQGQFLCDFRYAPFGKDHRSGPRTAQERETSSLIENALSVSIQLEKFPKSVVEAYVVVLEDGGGVIAAAITCVSLALADAGIDLYNLVSACQVARVGSSTLVGPSKEELDSKECQGSVLLAYMPVLKQISYLSQTGQLDFDAFNAMVTLSTSCCEQLHALMRHCLLTAAWTIEKAPS
eukprot:g80357.t1